ncbi:accessory gene regulator B family protein [Bacillus sonorensis]|nr:accessory gene regulator B family protein [Bacillus sonorensis]
MSEQIIYYNPDFRSRQDSIRYGLEWMLAAINQILLVFIIACYFDCVIQAMVILSAGGFLRMFSGEATLKVITPVYFSARFKLW